MTPTVDEVQQQQAKKKSLINVVAIAAELVLLS